MPLQVCADAQFERPPAIPLRSARFRPELLKGIAEDFELNSAKTQAVRRSPGRRSSASDQSGFSGSRCNPCHLVPIAIAGFLSQPHRLAA
jgi:hypothetical protein